MWPAKHGRPISRCAPRSQASCGAITMPSSSCSCRRRASRPHAENRPVCAIIATSAAHPNKRGSMKRLSTGVVILVLARGVFSAPSIYPTGTTIYRPDKAWNGYTLFDTPNEQGAVLIDMNGTLVRRWKEVAAVPGPARLLPGGDVIGGSTRRRPHQEALAL